MAFTLKQLFKQVGFAQSQPGKAIKHVNGPLFCCRPARKLHAFVRSLNLTVFHGIKPKRFSTLLKKRPNSLRKAAFAAWSCD